MTAYNETEYDLRKWPTTTATPTLARAAAAAAPVAVVALPLVAERKLDTGCSRLIGASEKAGSLKTLPHGIQGTVVNRLSGSSSNRTMASAWGFA